MYRVGAALGAVVAGMGLSELLLPMLEGGIDVPVASRIAGGAITAIGVGLLVVCVRELRRPRALELSVGSGALSVRLADGTRRRLGWDNPELSLEIATLAGRGGQRVPFLSSPELTGAMPGGLLAVTDAAADDVMRTAAAHDLDTEATHPWRWTRGWTVEGGFRLLARSRTEARDAAPASVDYHADLPDPARVSSERAPSTVLR